MKIVTTNESFFELQATTRSLTKDVLIDYKLFLGQLLTIFFNRAVRNFRASEKIFNQCLVSAKEISTEQRSQKFFSNETEKIFYLPSLLKIGNIKLQCKKLYKN